MKNEETDKTDIINVIEKKSSNEFSDTNKVSGIYIILNKVNNKWYVGSSNNVVKTRWKKHRYTLRKNIHDTPKLQNAWNKYGESNFEFHIVELVEESQLLIVEQKYLDYAKLHKDDCYNTWFIARGGSTKDTNGVKGKKKIHKGDIEKMVWPDKLNEYILDGWKLGHSEKHKDICRTGGKGHIPWNKGIPRTNELKEKLSKIQKGRFTGKDSPHWGKHRTDEVKQKIREKQKGKKVSIESIKWRLDTKLYTFYNQKTRETFVGTRYEFKIKSKLRPRSIVDSYISGKRKSLYDWILIT